MGTPDEVMAVQENLSETIEWIRTEGEDHPQTKNACAELRASVEKLDERINGGGHGG